MRARLSFATVTSIEPDILIIDEALSTGDARFVQKCEKRIRAMCGRGVTALFVSHNLNQIKNLCQRCLVIGQGSVLFDGSTSEAANYYVREVERVEETRLDQENSARWTQLREDRAPRLKILDAFFRSEKGKTSSLISEQPSELCLVFESPCVIPRARLEILVRTEKSHIPYAVWPPGTDALFEERPARRHYFVPRGKGQITVSLPALPIGDGRYSCDVLLYPDGMGPQQIRALDPAEADQFVCEKAFGFQVCYEDKVRYGRGTIAEMIVRSVRMTGPAPDATAALPREV
jgi:hypothetical protein